MQLASFMVNFKLQVCKVSTINIAWLSSEGKVGSECRRRLMKIRGLVSRASIRGMGRPWSHESLSCRCRQDGQHKVFPDPLHGESGMLGHDELES
jgi:hypothetical protein